DPGTAPSERPSRRRSAAARFWPWRVPAPRGRRRPNDRWGCDPTGRSRPAPSQWPLRLRPPGCPWRVRSGSGGCDDRSALRLLHRPGDVDPILSVRVIVRHAQAGKPADVRGRLVPPAPDLFRGEAPLLQLVLEQLFDGRCAEAHAFRAHHHVELVVQHIRMLLEVDDERAKDALQVAPELFPISLTLHEEADEFARVPAQRLGVSHGGDDGGEEVRGLVPRQLSQRTTSNLEHRGVPPQSAAPRGEPYSLRSRPWISWSLSSIERHTPASWSHHGSSETKEAEVFTSKRR